MASGRAVYLHCHGGKGRSAVVAVAWIMKTCSITKEKVCALPPPHA